MSLKENKEITCPHCGAVANENVFSYIQVEKDPHLREKIMDESLFYWQCKDCGFTAQLATPCLYHDAENNVMVFFLPEYQEEVLDDTAVEMQFPALKNVRKRIADSVNVLKEKIVLFEAGLDDMAVELTKLAVSSVVSKKYEKKIEQAYFLYNNEEEQTIGFSFFLEGDVEPVFYDTRWDVYEKCKSIVEKCAVPERQDARYLNINQAWARKILHLYHSEE